MPSSSARCAQLPRAADKVPFYMALKKFRDYLNGHLDHLDESEVVFDDPKYKNCHESEPKPEIPIQYGPDGLPIDDGKKKRGRPKKNKALEAAATANSNPNDMSIATNVGVDENSSNKQLLMASNSNNSVNSQMCNELGQNNGQMMQGMMPGATFDLSKKKRGRPKKQKGMENNGGNAFSQQPSQTKQKQARTQKSPPMPPQTNISMQQQQQSQQPPQTHFNSQNFNMMHNPVDTLTPPPSVGYQQNSMGYNGTSIKNHPGYQQSPQPNSQCYSTPSDMSSDISGATITNDHNSPTTATTPIDFNPASNDNNTNECRFSSPASTISEQQSHNMNHRHQTPLDMNYQSSPYSTPNRNQTPNGGVNESSSQQHYGSYGAPSGEHGISQQYAQSQLKSQHHHSPSFSPHLSNNPVTGARNSPQQSHKMQQQQQQPQGNNTTTKEYGTTNTDVATKSLSGLESLVNEIPTESERLSHQSASEYALKSEASALLSDQLAQYSSNPHADPYSPYSTHPSLTSSASSSFSSVPSQFSSSSHYSGIANPTPSSYNMSNPFSVNNLLTPNHSYGAAAAAYAKAGPPAPPPPGHHLTPTNHLFMEPPHMPVAMFPYTQQPSYTYPTGAPHPSLLNPSYPHPYSPYSNPGFTSHHMFDRF